MAKESSPRTNDLNHISGRINEICTSFEFGYPLLYVPISDSWRFININDKILLDVSSIAMAKRVKPSLGNIEPPCWVTTPYGCHWLQ